MIWQKYAWIFPFIGGFVTIIGVLTPVASFFSFFQLWMWGLIIIRDYGISVQFINAPIILSVGIISSILLIGFSLLLISTGYLYKKGKFENYKISKIWIASGIIILIATIIPLVTLDFYTYEPFYFYGIWTFCDPGFGAIGPIIGAILAIVIGGMILRSKAGRREPPIPISTLAPKDVCPHCGKPVSLNANFCSRCGKTIKRKDY
jgi:hypothetical protein